VDRLKEKVAIITGAANGQGRAAALLFAQEAAKVVVADFDDEAGKKVVEEITNNGGIASFYHIDVTKEEEVAALVDFAVKTYGRLDIMYNNAGLCRFAPIGELSTEDWEFDITFELHQVYYGCKYAIKQMEKQGGGVIINTASIAGLIGLPTQAAHSATKAGVIGLTRGIAVDYGQKGIRCNAVAPGYIPFTKQLKEMGFTDNEEFNNTMLMMQALKRLGTPEDIANAALFLASDEASFITGHVLVVDGGYTAL